MLRQGTFVSYKRVMLDFLKQILVYFICFMLSLYALSALDFKRFIKKNAAFKAQVLYLILAMAIAYLFAQFLMGIMYSYASMPLAYTYR